MRIDTGSDNAEAARTQAQLAMQQAQQTYNDLKQQTPKMPVLSDFTESSADYLMGNFRRFRCR